jgi:hypothetical protein
MVNLWNPWFGVWDYDKIMEPTSEKNYIIMKKISKAESKKKLKKSTKKMWLE